MINSNTCLTNYAELPEVETICNAIEQSIDSPKIDEFKIINNKLRWKISGNIPSRVNGQVIKKIYRRAKYIVFKFDHGSLITPWNDRSIP